MTSASARDQGSFRRRSRNGFVTMLSTRYKRTVYGRRYLIASTQYNIREYTLTRTRARTHVHARTRQHPGRVKLLARL